MVVLDLVVIALAIALEPLTIVAFILVLSVEMGLRNGLAFLLGWFACLVAVVAIVVGLTGGEPPAPHTAPSSAALVVKAVLGALLIWYGIRRWRRRGQPRQQPKWMARLKNLSPWAAFGLGVFLQPWTLVAAGADAVVRARLSTAGEWLTLVLYCLLATSTFLAMELYARLRRERARVRFDKLHAWIDVHLNQVVVAGALVIGAYLLADSIYLLVA